MKGEEKILCFGIVAQLHKEQNREKKINQKLILKRKKIFRTCFGGK